MKLSSRYALIALTFLAVEIFLFNFVDRSVANFMHDLDAAHPDLVNFFRATTDFGKSKWYLWPSAVAILLCSLVLHVGKISTEQGMRIARLAHDLVFFFACIAISGIVTDLIKPLLGRARPVELTRDNLYGFHPFTMQAVFNAMPSGHATTAAALATALIILLPRGRILWLAIGFALALSRVMVNAHYVSDIVAGIAVGTVTTLLIQGWRRHQGMFPILSGIFPIDRRI